MIARSHVRLLDASQSGEGEIDKLAFEVVRASSLRAGDLILCTRDDVIPAAGVVVEGRARVAAGEDEAWTAAPLRVDQGVRLTFGYLVVRLDD